MSEPRFTGLPADILAAVRGEETRVAAELLAPRGLAQRQVLIVGGGGYIGIPLSLALLADGYRVRCLDQLVYGQGACLHGLIGQPGYDFRHGDICDPAAVEAALAGITDVIILAGLVGDPVTKAFPEAHAAINEAGLASFIDCLNGRGLNKVIFVSTCSNYGEIPDGAVADESYELKPLSLYAKAKVAREQQLMGLKGRVDYCATVLRFATAFGLSGRMRFDLTVSEFTRDLHAGSKLEVYDADTWRPYCHVQDFAEVLARVLAFPRDRVSFDVFNAGGDVNNFTKKMIVEAVQAEVPSGTVSYVKGGGDRRNYRVNFAKIRGALFFEPHYTVQDGIRELARALDQGFFADFATQPARYRNDKVIYAGT